MTKTFSPVIKEDPKLKDMSFDFDGAVETILFGGMVARKSWDDGIYCFLVREVLHIRNDKGIHRLILCRADLEAVDWVVIKNIKE